MNPHRDWFSAGLFLAILSIASVAGAKQSAADLYRDSYALESAGKIKAATNKVLTVLRQEPESYFANLRAGWLYYLQGKSEESVRYYDRAVGLKPMAVEPLLGKLLPLVGIAAWGDVIKAARKVLAIDPGNFQANSKLAYALYMSGNFAKAAKVYSFLVERYPSNVEMKLGLGWSNLKMAKTQRARGLFLEALKINSSSQKAANGLAACAAASSGAK